ncbi:MAG: GxxExxY protein [bacterium]|nr:GxxExxY protein [bacterium]
MNTNLQILTNKKQPVELIHSELSFAVVGLCYDIHNELGRFAKEKQYADGLEEKLKSEDIPSLRELRIGNTNNIADFLVDDKIILELKSKRFLLREDYLQTQRYLQATGVLLGILVNFGGKYVRTHRVVKIEHSSRNPD